MKFHFSEVVKLLLIRRWEIHSFQAVNEWSKRHKEWPLIQTPENCLFAINSTQQLFWISLQGADPYEEVKSISTSNFSVSYEWKKILGSTWTTTDKRNWYHFISKFDEQNMRGGLKLESCICTPSGHWMRIWTSYIFSCFWKEIYSSKFFVTQISFTYF